MAANAKQDLADRDSAGFGAAYAVQRIVLVIQYLRARREAKTRGLTTIYAAGFGTAAIFWIVAALTPPPARFWLWGVALLIDFATPWAAVKYTHTVPPDAEHLPERFGLFTIILLGESVAAVMRGMESQESWPVSAAVSAFTGLALVFALWWWYFDLANGAAERHIKTARDTIRFQIWSHAHFPLYLSIAVLGVGLERVISLPTGAQLAVQHAWILVGAAVVLMTTLMIVEATSARRESVGTRAVRCLLVLAILPVPLFSHRLPPCGLILQLFLISALQLGLNRIHVSTNASSQHRPAGESSLGSSSLPAS
jgi:low temperature requirement protein LtrA